MEANALSIPRGRRFAARGARRVLLSVLSAVSIGAVPPSGAAETLPAGPPNSGPAGGSGAMTVLRESPSSMLAHPIRRRRPGYGGYTRPESYISFGVGAFDPSEQPGSGLYVSGSAGGVVAEQIDLGLQLSWYHRSRGGEQFISEYTDPAGNTVRQVLETRSVSTNLVPLLVTARVRFPVAPGVEPYLGGGIGWEWLSVEGTDDLGLPFSNDYSGFGAQGIAGVALAAGPRASVYGEAVYNASTVSAEFDDPFLAQTVREEVDFDGVGFHAGLRFRF